jgi:hypothetical protein
LICFFEPHEKTVIGAPSDDPARDLPSRRVLSAEPHLVSWSRRIPASALVLFFSFAAPLGPPPNGGHRRIRQLYFSSSAILTPCSPEEPHHDRVTRNPGLVTFGDRLCRPPVLTDHATPDPKDLEAGLVGCGSWSPKESALVVHGWEVRGQSVEFHHCPVSPRWWEEEPEEE